MRYKTENQILAKSLAPRAPYLLTSGDCEMSDVFISSVATRPNKYSAKPRFGLIREVRFAGFGLCGCNRPRYEKKAIGRFGLIREKVFGTWHGQLGAAPHLEQRGLPGLNWATIFSLALNNNTVF
jgi:hypothetical protein